MSSILKISDGTTTIDFVADTSGYALTEWSPAVANRRRGMFGGRGAYADVVETMRVNIHGTAPLDKLATLRTLLEQSERWYAGEPVDPVLLHYQPTSTSAELKATIMGADGDSPMVRLPGDLPQGPLYQYLDGIELRFRRLGMWLGASVTGTSSDLEHPRTHTVNLTTSVDLPSPITVKVVESAAAERGMPPSFVIMASGATTTEAAGRVVIFEAEELSLGALAFTTAADSTNDASGNTLLRYTPQTAATWATSANESVVSSTDTTVRTWGVFLNYRSNGTGTSHRVRMKANARQNTRELFIPEGTSNPTWVYLDTLRINGTPLDGVRLQAQSSNTAGTVDFDTIALLALDDEIASRVVRPVFGEEIGTSFDPSENTTIDHMLLSEPSAAIFSSYGFNPRQGFVGDATLMMRGSAVAVAWLSTSERAAAAWRPTDSSNNAVSSVVVITRLEARLTPK